MQATEKKSINKIWLAAISVVAVVALVLGIVGIVNHNETKANAIPTINQQVDNIKNTLPELEAVSTELKGYIDNLETTAQKLQADLTATNTALDALETEVYSKVDAEKTATLNQLKADKTELEGKIAAANKAIEDAKTANAASEKAITDQIAALKTELEKADADNKTAIEAQITALNNDLSALIKKNADAIAVLETTASDLQKQINNTNTKIDNIKTELEGKISESEKKVLGDLNTVKEALEAQLTTINNTIKVLQEKDTELEGKITGLQTYVDSKLKDTKDWANTTFFTLEQYKDTQTTIAGIKQNIEDINADIAAIEKDIDEQVEAIKKSIADLDAELAEKVTEITTGYTDAVATAKTEITNAYTTAIATAITNSETYMQSWVNKKLADGYYDIAVIDAKLKAITDVAATDEELATAVAKQEKLLDDAYNTLKEEYKAAITTAINDNNAIIDGKIAAAVKTAQDNLQAKIDEINGKIKEINARLDDIEKDVTALKAQIQSVTFVPLYNDGAVKMAPDAAGSKYAFFDFRVSPKDAAAALNASDLTMEAVYTTDAAQRGDTRGSVNTVTLSILEVSGDANTGIVTVKVSGANLSADFYNGTVSASAVLTIKTGATEIVSDYVPMVAHSQVWTNIVSVQDWIEATLAGGEAEQNN